MKVALFPGQGLDARVVRKALDPNHPRVQAASELLGYDLVARVDEVARRVRGVLPTSIAQPAIFTAGVIAHEVAADAGERFDYFAGHSLGEYTALVAAGAIRFGPGLRLVAARGAAMERVTRRSPGGMAALLGLGIRDAEEIASVYRVTVANDNSPVQVVLSGDTDNLARAAEGAKSKDARCILLPVEGAFHSVAMDPATEAVADALVETDVRSPNVPVISNVTARPYRAPGEIRKRLVEQLTGRVRFRESMLYLRTQSVSDFIDLGPGDVVGRLARATVPTNEESVVA